MLRPTHCCASLTTGLLITADGIVNFLGYAVCSQSFRTRVSPYRSIPETSSCVGSTWPKRGRDQGGSLVAEAPLCPESADEGSRLEAPVLSGAWWGPGSMHPR